MILVHDGSDTFFIKIINQKTNRIAAANPAIDSSWNRFPTQNRTGFYAIRLVYRV